MLFRKNLKGGLAAGLTLLVGIQGPLYATTVASPAASVSVPVPGGNDATGYSRTSYEPERWVAENCVAERRSNTTAGAVVGALLGAAAGTGLAGRHDQAAGAILGGTAGAVAGGAIGSESTPSNCPAGYVTRPYATVYYAPPAYYPPVAYPSVVYAAPGWYRPWVWTGGAWVYRPYPAYHYFYRPYRRW